jgi:hypothetical protein
MFVKPVFDVKRSLFRKIFAQTPIVKSPYECMVSTAGELSFVPLFLFPGNVQSSGIFLENWAHKQNLKTRCTQLKVFSHRTCRQRNESRS